MALKQMQPQGARGKQKLLVIEGGPALSTTSYRTGHTELSTIPIRSKITNG